MVNAPIPRLPVDRRTRDGVAVVVAEAAVAPEDSDSFPHARRSAP